MAAVGPLPRRLGLSINGNQLMMTGFRLVSATARVKDVGRSIPADIVSGLRDEGENRKGMILVSSKVLRFVGKSVPL